ncbi:flagellar hook-basal body protein [Thalassobacillus hwangdonensis]|uniref:Flagellar hook-basal body protein n=1 Tax=Thalassobacillus hwangdonensis TaxID=546108 RepID=A0ABW3L4R7_9BACI
MSRSMIQAAVTMGQLQQKLDVIGNNLSNSNTPGYKAKQADFASLLFQQIDNLNDEENQTGRITPDGVRIGSGAKLSHIDIDLSKGTLQRTDRALDAALLQDNHLFQVQIPTEDGTETRYTRAGNFYLSELGDGRLQLTNGSGYPIIGEDGPILFEEGFDGIAIQEDGSILVERNGQETEEGRLATVEAAQPRMLESAGGSTFRLPDLEALGLTPEQIIVDVEENDVQLQSGSLETSNVDVSKQMSEMLMAQRAYQFNGRSISIGDQMMGLVNQLR